MFSILFNFANILIIYDLIGLFTKKVDTILWIISLLFVTKVFFFYRNVSYRTTSSSNL